MMSNCLMHVLFFYRFMEQHFQELNFVLTLFVGSNMTKSDFHAKVKKQKKDLIKYIHRFKSQLR